jgi:dihydrodipicolinate synthase/N-acetylneuraminate lyase
LLPAVKCPEVSEVIIVKNVTVPSGRKQHYTEAALHVYRLQQLFYNIKSYTNVNFTAEALVTHIFKFIKFIKVTVAFQK